MKMFKYLFQITKLKSEVEALQQENYDLHNTVDCLLKEIGRRDQKIAEQQRRLNFFGITIGNEVDFPATDKIQPKGAWPEDLNKILKL